MRSEDLKTRIMAQYLRRQMEGRILPHVLANIHDDDLVAHYLKRSAPQAVGEVQTYARAPKENVLAVAESVEER